MTRENPTWGAPRIQKELAILGYEVSEATVYRYRDRSTKPPSQTWCTFLKNHIHETVAVDFFVVPTVTFDVLYVFIVFQHARRKILHFNITMNPTAEWTAFQIKQEFSWGPHLAAKFLHPEDTCNLYKLFEIRIQPMGNCVPASHFQEFIQ